MERAHLLCIRCVPYKFLPSLTEFNRHLSNFHGGDKVFVCGKCKEEFHHKTSMIRHIRSFHMAQRSSDESDNEQEADSGEPIPFEAASEPADEDPAPLSPAHQFPLVLPQPLSLKDEAARFIMKLRSSGNITHASISMVLDHVTTFLEQTLLEKKTEVAQFLERSGVSAELASEFLTSTFKIDNLFDGLQSIDEQLEYFSMKFGLAIPQKKFLYYRVDNRFDRKHRNFLPKQIPVNFQYISLKETLILIVRNPHLRSLILSEEPSEDGVYRTDKDGSDFKNNEFLQKYPYAIRIVLYYDDLEIANALGSKDVIHKLGCFYFSSLNLPPEEISKLSSIFLLALCYAEDLKEKGAFQKVMLPFISELRDLQSDEGVVVDLPEGGTYTLRACLVGLSADALAAHALLGLLSPSASKFCRACLLSIPEFMQNSVEVGTLRTATLHQEQVREVEENPAAASLYGIKERSPLSEIMKVPEDSIFDPFHDLVGVAQMILKLVLYEYVCVRELFTCFKFNSYLNSFNYGAPDVKNKPSPNFVKSKLYSKGHSLKQYGSQTFCLLRIFPFVVTGVDENDKYLKLVFLLQDIVRVVFSSELRASDIIKLDTLFYQFGHLFHETFVSATEEQTDDAEGVRVGVDTDNLEEEEDLDDVEECSDNSDIDASTHEETENNDDPPRRRRRWTSRKLKRGINKLHHLSHYTMQMLRKGPIIRFGCARFEGRHRIFRKHSAVQSNFQNPPLTMARMFQLSSLDAVLSRKALNELEVGKMDLECTSVNESQFSAQLQAHGMTGETQIKFVAFVEVSGDKYESGLFVQLKREAHLPPSFALITDIIVDSSESSMFLVVNKCQNTFLSARYNAYQVNHDVIDTTAVLLTLKDLSHHRPIAPWTPVSSCDSGTYYLYPRNLCN